MHARHFRVHSSSKEVTMNWSSLIRQFHRWVSFIFMVAVVATTIALMQKEPIVWMSYVPLLPLFLLMISGVYMFVLPYVTKRRNAQRAGE
jgi:hypothetical protein